LTVDLKNSTLLTSAINKILERRIGAGAIHITY